MQTTSTMKATELPTAQMRVTATTPAKTLQRTSLKTKLPTAPTKIAVLPMSTAADINQSMLLQSPEG